MVNYNRNYCKIKWVAFLLHLGFFMYDTKVQVQVGKNPSYGNWYFLNRHGKWIGKIREKIKYWIE